jgi:hypothetical protein
MKKAIVFIAYDRPHYFKVTLESWSMVKDIEQYDIYFSIDRTEDRKIFKNQLKLINDFKFKIPSKVYIHINDPKFGMGHNQHNSLNRLFSLDYDFIIQAEEDVVVSKDVLHYFNQMISVYLQDDYVTLNAFSLTQDDKRIDGYFEIRSWGCPWVWGISKDSWNKYLKDKFDFHNTISWDVMLWKKYKNTVKSLFPVSSRTKNIGIWGHYNKGKPHAVNIIDNSQFNNKHYHGKFKKYQLDEKKDKFMIQAQNKIMTGIK